jgi:hypothetical protein
MRESGGQECPPHMGMARRLTAFSWLALSARVNSLSSQFCLLSLCLSTSEFSANRRASLNRTAGGGCPYIRAG